MPASYLNGVKIDWIDASIPAPARGETGTYLVKLDTPYATPELPSEEHSAYRRWEVLRDMFEYSGDGQAYELFETDDSQFRYVDTTPGHFEHSPLTLLDTPHHSAVPSMYALLEAVEPAEPIDREYPVYLDIDLRYMAPADEYDGLEAARAALEEPGM